MTRAMWLIAVLTVCLASGAVPGGAEPPATDDELLLAKAHLAPAEALGQSYLDARHTLLLCRLARAGATIHLAGDGTETTIDATNVEAAKADANRRSAIYEQAVRRRGFRRLAPGYVARVEGGCEAWELFDAPVIVEQDRFDLHLTHGPLRHPGVVVESTVVFRHESNSDLILTGTLTEDGLAFEIPAGDAVAGRSEAPCTWRLVPEKIAGPAWAEAFVGRALARRSYGDHADVVADLERSLELHADTHIAGLLAWVLATCPDAHVRDGAKAVAAARRAVELNGGAVDLDLAIFLAVAHAEAGDFKTAIEYQRKVIELTPDEAKPQQLEHLKRFEEGKPFHEEPGPAGFE